MAHSHHCVKCGVTDLCDQPDTQGCVHFPTLHCESCIDLELAISAEQQALEDLDNAIAEYSSLVSQFSKLTVELKAALGQPCPF